MKLEKVVELLKAGKKNEAQKALEEYLQAAKLSDAEEGGVYLELASLFTKVNTDLLADYKEILEVVGEELRDLNIKEKILNPKK